MPSKLTSLLPWTKSPLIINAPMAGSATAPLARAVTLSGGLGQIGSADNMQTLSNELSTLSNDANFPRTPSGLLPVGVGFLLFLADLEQAAAVLREHRPAVVWLFAARGTEDYVAWAARAREASPGCLVWVQVGDVEGAVEVAREARPDVLCVQGADAGGHGLAKSAGLVALLPEVREGLEEKVLLVGAGGVGDGRGVAAVLALGAEGVVMGTRFLGARETVLHGGWREAVLRAKDGGRETVKSMLYDELRGPSIWPEGYDGRSVVNESAKDFEKGVGIEQVRESFAEASKQDDRGYGPDGKARAPMWAGTGVGLVTREQSASEIVEEVRSGAVKALEDAKARL